MAEPVFFGPEPEPDPEFQAQDEFQIPPPGAAAPLPDMEALVSALLPLLITALRSAAAGGFPPVPEFPPGPDRRASTLPHGVKAPPIDNFDGKKVKEVRTWVSRTRRTLVMSGFALDHPDAVRYVASFLTGPAQSWFESECLRSPGHLQDTAGFYTFDQFSNALIAQIGDPHPEDKARKALCNLRQTTSVKAYADEFQRIIVLLPHRHHDDLRYDFIFGLKPKIKELLVGKVVDVTWQDMRDLAYRYDDVVMMNRSTSIAPRHTSYHDNRRDDPMELGTASASSPRRSRDIPPRGRSPSPYPRPNSSGAPHRSTTPGRRPALPKLTAELRDKLKKNNGCFRCQRMNAGHLASECPGLPFSETTPAARSRPSSPKN